jgi:hypothetical protein
METKNLDGLAAQLRIDAEQEALQHALLVPWSRLEEAAAAYVEWHAFILWVRAIADTVEQVPDIIASTLEIHCPGFRQWERGCLDWRALEDWIITHRFAEPKAQGWFDALMYYAYKNVRAEQAWTVWERRRAEWSQQRSSRWPTIEEWSTEVVATRTLSQPGTEKARAVEALANVEPARLRKAVSDTIEARALAFWADCASEAQRPLDDAVLGEVRSRCPGLVAASGPTPNWRASLFLRLIRFQDAGWRAKARAEGWYAALRYHVIHHPRYHRLEHYRQRCLDERLQVPRVPSPSFTEWLAAADAYFVAPGR